MGTTLNLEKIFEMFDASPDVRAEFERLAGLVDENEGLRSANTTLSEAYDVARARFRELEAKQLGHAIAFVERIDVRELVRALVDAPPAYLSELAMSPQALAVRDLILAKLREEARRV